MNCSEADYQRWLTWLEETLRICRRMQHRAAIAYHVRALLKEETASDRALLREEER